MTTEVVKRKDRTYLVLPLTERTTVKDVARFYGSDEIRFHEPEPGVFDLGFGEPLSAGDYIVYSYVSREFTPMKRSEYTLYFEKRLGDADQSE